MFGLQMLQWNNAATLELKCDLNVFTYKLIAEACDLHRTKPDASTKNNLEQQFEEFCLKDVFIYSLAKLQKN